MGDKQAERTLPHDIEVEQALLGALMVDEDALAKVSDRLVPDDFHDPLHQRVCRAILSISGSGAIASPLTVKAALGADPGLAEVGGQPYLVSIARSAPVRANVVDYARILRELSQRRDLIEIGECMVAAAYAPPADTTPRLIADQAAEQLHDSVHGRDPGEGPVSIFELAHRAAALAGEAMADPRKVCLSTGLQTVDDGIGMLFRGDLHVLGAATSMGKTALVQKFLRTAAFSGFAALMFSLEMSGVSVATRFVSETSGVPSDRMRQGKITDPELDKIARAPEVFVDIRHLLKIDDTPNLSVAQMRARVHAMKRRRPELALVVIDHLQFIAPADPRATTDEQARQITRDLCTLAKDFNVAVVLISHLTKDNERRNSKRPIMADLYGSGGIAQNADSVWFLYRAIYYLEKEPVEVSEGKAYDDWLRMCEYERGWAEIFSTKVRMGRAGQSVRVRFHEALTTFSDPEPKREQQLSEQDRLALAGGKMR